MQLTNRQPVTSPLFHIIDKTPDTPKLSNVKQWDHQLFDRLTPPQWNWLSEKITFKTVSPKSVIFRPEDLANQFFFIQEGKVKVEIIQDTKNWFIRDILSADDVFGLNGLLGQTTRREYARSLRSKVKLAIVNNSDLTRLMEVNFHFAESIMEEALTKAIKLEQRSIGITIQTASRRLVNFLLKRIRKDGHFNGKDWYYNSEITQEELGAYIGTGRQTVTEVLMEFKSQNLLTYNWGKFWVHDLPALEKLQ